MQMSCADEDTTITSLSYTQHTHTQQVISKLCLLLDNYGTNEVLVMLSHLEHRMRTKQVRMSDFCAVQASLKVSVRFLHLIVFLKHPPISLLLQK